KRGRARRGKGEELRSGLRERLLCKTIIKEWRRADQERMGTLFGRCRVSEVRFREGLSRSENKELSHARGQVGGGDCRRAEPALSYREARKRPNQNQSG